MLDHVVRLYVSDRSGIELSQVGYRRSNIRARRVEVNVDQPFDVVLTATQVKLGASQISEL